MNDNNELENVITFPKTPEKSEGVFSDTLTETAQKEEVITLTAEELSEFSNSDEAGMADLKFKIENFEGPLDLLLHLIKKSKMEIEEVKLSAITEQYLEIMEQIENVDLEVASEFIEVAATLIEIKSKALLPKLISEEEEEQDPEVLLLQRLNEYKLFKESCEKLKPLENVDRFYKKPERDANKFRIVIKDMQLEMLLNAFTGILHRVTEVEKNATPKEVIREVFTVAGKIAAIKDALVIKEKVKFSELFENSSTRGEIITTFLAVLEMLKLQQIRCTQSEVFNEIEILKADEIDG